MIGLKLLDIVLFIMHLLIVGFNLLGWIWPRTRRAHGMVVVITAACWFLLGIWYGIGYCPVTDWQWQVKAKLGETDLPNSFIEYVVEAVSGVYVSSSLVDVFTAAGFVLAMVMAVYFNFFKKKPESH